MNPFSGWQNFYVIVGSSAGALIGLQFVVMALISEIPTRMDPEAGAAFATPNIVHFSSALLLSASMSIPWRGLNSVAVLWAVLGAAGAVYAVLTLRRMRSQKAYRPEFEDWLFHAVLPFLAYAVLAVASYGFREHERASLFAAASASLLLLFVGIHNAWDAVTYHVYVRRQREEAKPGDRGKGD